MRLGVDTKEKVSDYKDRAQHCLLSTAVPMSPL